MATSEQLRDAALWPNWDLPDPPPGHPFKLTRHDGYCVGAFSGTADATVFVKDISADVERVVAEARALVVERQARTGRG